MAEKETKQTNENTTKTKKQSKQKRDVKNMTEKQIWELKKEYFEHKIAVANGSENDTAKLKKLRKDIARATMHLKQRKQNGEKAD